MSVQTAAVSPGRPGSATTTISAQPMCAFRSFPMAAYTIPIPCPVTTTTPAPQTIRVPIRPARGRKGTAKTTMHAQLIPAIR
jgi:hypothetical protein